MYIIVSFVFVYEFTPHCHRVETKLQLRNIMSDLALNASVSALKCRKYGCKTTFPFTRYNH